MLLLVVLITVLVSKYVFYFHSYTINCVNIKCTRFYINRCSYYGVGMIFLLYSTIITTYELFYPTQYMRMSSFDPERCGGNFSRLFPNILGTDIFTISVDIVMRLKLQNLLNDKPALVYLKIWCMYGSCGSCFCPKHRRLSRDKQKNNIGAILLKPK